jgi:hypothetical protein
VKGTTPLPADPELVEGLFGRERQCFDKLSMSGVGSAEAQEAGAAATSGTRAAFGPSD